MSGWRTVLRTTYGTWVGRPLPCSEALYRPYRTAYGVRYKQLQYRTVVRTAYAIRIGRSVAAWHRVNVGHLQPTPYIHCAGRSPGPAVSCCPRPGIRPSGMTAILRSVAFGLPRPESSRYAAWQCAQILVVHVAGIADYLLIRGKTVSLNSFDSSTHIGLKSNDTVRPIAPILAG